MKTKAQPKYVAGTRVKVRGRGGDHVINWPMVVPVPQIIKGEFTLVETIMYKFITKEETFYAYENDVAVIQQSRRKS